MEIMDSSKRVLNLYVTFVEKEGPFLKLWGQTDKNNAVYVEKFLSQVAPQFDIGVGKLQSDGITAGSLVCAKYKDGKYYRAKILNNIYGTEGFLEVSFIDFGNKELVSSDDIRSLQNFPPSLLAIPGLAVGFIFAEAHCMGGGEWNDTIFDSIAKEIKYRTVQCTLLTPATNFYLVRVAVEGTDLGSVLLQRGLMQPIPLQAQQAVLLSMSMQKQSAQAPQQTVTNISTGINTYKACTLEPGCQYPVYVSYVNDGPCVFSVQLKQTEDVLVKLMNDINSNTLRLLEDIPIPGTICLARCQDDGNICRAVVTNAVDTQFKVFYVDFGNYEVLPLECLYQIPFKYVLPKVMAIRFALEGVDKSTVTRDMQIAFKRFVDNRLLHMKVIPSPIRTPLPKCELWDPESKTSALDVVIRSAKHSYPEPVVLPRGFSQPVKVSFVYSCNRFYVQLSNKESELTTVMENLQEFCQTNDLIDFNSIKIGIPCCALFSGDNLWYRSEVVEINEDSVKVRYIDYGNEELVMIDQLKSIDGEILTVLRPQAIECCLNGYQKMNPDEERDRLLEELILEGVFTMKVVDKLDTKALVDLYDDANYNVASLLLDKLAAAKSQMSPVLAVQAGNKIEHRKSYKQRDQQNFKGGERNYNTGREQESWKQPQDKNERNERSSWRQDGRDNRNYDKKTNDNDSNSWRQNNKGFSPNSRLDKIRKDDTWNSNNDTSVNNNDDWGDSQKTTPPKKNWNSGGGQGNDDWNTSTNTEDSRPPKKDFRSNKGGGFNNDRGGRFRDDDRGGRFGDDKGGRFGNDRGGRFGDDRGGRSGNDREGRFGDDRGGRFGDKQRDGGFKKKEFRKDGSESSDSEKSFQKGPRSSSRLDRGNRGQHFDKPKNSYRDNRGGGGDAWDSNNTTTDSWNVSTVNSSIDAAPADATFVIYDVVGADTNVVISWFHNPGHFYCQQISYQDAFKSMMQDICDFYKDKKSEPVVQGAPVVALFPEDNVLYRARVLDVIGSQYKVHYVDFGNESIISKAWPIEKKFMELPAQAIACCLNGIAPPNGEWPNADTYSSYFDKDNFLCQFVNKDEERAYVNLFHNSEDISQVLIGQGLAISTISTIPDIEIPLLMGQQFRATVKSVNNLSDIILALECGLALNCSMHSLVNATETFDDSLKELLEQTVIVYVDNVLEDYRLEITLYDTEGNKHVILNPDEGAFDTVDIPCPMLVLRSTIYGYVPFADETSIFIQSNENVDLLTSLLDQLFEEYDEKPHDSTIIPEEGLIYAVHSEDTNWYRGKVISFDDDKATVYFIDYGNSEDVAFANLRELASKFLDIPILSLQVTVTEAESFVDKDVMANVYFGETGWEGTVSVVDASTAIISQTELVSQSKSDDSTDTGFITKSEEAVEENTIKEPEVAEISTIENSSISEEPVASSRGTSVLMSHIDSPNDFYLQFSENLSQIESIQEELQNTVADMEVLENPTPGVLCAAPYSVDQLWYRAEVLDADEDITTVRFVDFGNTDVIDNKSTQIKTLPQKLLSLAIYATRCSLKLEPLEEEWNSVALEVFEKLTSGENLTAEFLEQDEKCTYVLLFDGEINIEEAFIQENLAKPLSKVIETKQTGFVSHLNSPSEFWIQLENCVDELEWIAEQLSNAESFPEQEDLTPGTLCAALFPDDQMWYRARILSNTVAGIELLFIDYGNSCVSMSLRQLPEDLIMTPALAMKCSLSKNEGIPTWSPEAAKKFADISADGQTIFTVKKISTGETSVVQLYLDDNDVTTMLLPSTEDGFITELKSLEDLSLQKENGGDEIKNVILEPLEGQQLGDEAKEKLEELNKQGTTKFQIEFVNEKTVRLYLDGTDIRPLLETLHQDTNPELIVVIKDVSLNMKTENLEEKKCDKEEENEEINFNEAPQLDSPKKSPLSDSENTESEYEVNRDQKIEIDPEQVLSESSDEKIVKEITNEDQKLHTDIQNTHTIEDDEPQKEPDLVESIEYDEETNYNVKTMEDMNIQSENNLSQEEEPVDYVEQTEFESREIEESENVDETLATVDSTEVQYGDSTEENMVSSDTESAHSETKEQEEIDKLINNTNKLIEISSEGYAEEIIIQEENESCNRLEDDTEPNEGKFESTESIEYLEDHEIDCKKEDELTESNEDNFESTEKQHSDIESIEEQDIVCEKEDDLAESNEDKFESTESIEYLEDHEIDCKKEDDLTESNEDNFESTEKQHSDIESIEEHEIVCEKEDDLAESNEDKFESTESIEYLEDHEIDCKKEDELTESNEDKFESTEKQHSDIESIEEHEIVCEKEDDLAESNEDKFESTESIEYLEDHEIDCKKEDELTESNEDKFESTEKQHSDIESIEEHEIVCEKEDDLAESNEDKFESTESIEYLEDHEIDCKKEDEITESNEDKFESTEKQHSDIESIEEHEIDCKREDDLAESNEDKFESTESIEYLEDHDIDCKKEDDLTESNEDKFESTEKQYTGIESIEEHEIDCKKEDDLTESNEDKLESTEKEYSGIESIEEQEIDYKKEDTESNKDIFEEHPEEHEFDYKIEDEHVHSEASKSTNLSEPKFLLKNDVYDYDVVKSIINQPMEFLNISNTKEDLIESSEDTAGSSEDLKIESQECEDQNNKDKGSNTEHCIKEDVLKSGEVKEEAVLSTNDLKNESQESDVKSQDVLEQNTIEIVDDSPKKERLQSKKTNKDLQLNKTTEGSKSVKVSKPTPKTDVKSSKTLLPQSKKSTENLAVKSATTKASSVSKSVSNQTLSKTACAQKSTESSKNSPPKNKITKSLPKVDTVTKLTGSPKETKTTTKSDDSSKLIGSPKETKTTTKTDDSSKVLNPSTKVTKVNKQSVSTDLSTGKKSISPKSVSQDNKKTSQKNTKVDNNSKTADKKPEKKLETEVDLTPEKVE